MKVISKLSCLTLLAILAGCGGGSSGSGALGSAAAVGATSADTTSAAKLAEVEASTPVAQSKQAAVEKLDASWVSVATEGQAFTVPANTVVQYGAGSSWIQLTVSGPASCVSPFFGQDPAPGVLKSCYTQTGSTSGATTTPTTTLLANEGSWFSLSAPTLVQFGAGSGWTQKTMSGSVQCSTAFFGGADPAPNVAKACYSVSSATTTTPAATTPTTPATPTTTTGTLLANEGSWFSLSASTLVQFGAGSGWTQKTMSGAVQCSTAFFGGADPAPNVAKACYTVGTATTTPPATTTPTTPATPATPTTPTTTTGTLLANEGNWFSLAASTPVQFGAGSGWTQKTMSGSVQCSTAFFGGADPAPGVAKACYTVASTSGSSPAGGSTTTAPPSSANGGTAVAGDIVDAQGQVSAAAYRAMAAQLSTDAGIAYRYGTASAAIGGLPTIGLSSSTLFPSSAGFGIPVTYQLGSFSADPGDYSSTVGQVAFVPDDTTQYLGVGTLEFLAQRNNTYSEAPQFSWPYGGDPGSGLNERNSRTTYKSGTPVAMGRCYGRTTWCVNTVMAFPNGLIGIAGSNTASNIASTQLAAGKVPTGVAVTNGGEFALITVWDTVNLKGQIAVVALAGGCPTCGGGQYWGEWPALYPGLPNLNNIAFMKVVGYVDLPGMIAPTEISVTNNLDAESMQRVYPPGTCSGGFVQHEALPLSDAANRQTFMAGACNYNSYAHGGVAVVISKSEKRAAFVNLKPLFDYYQSMYFSDANFAQTTSLGQGANQWPFTFDTAASQTPTVIKTIDLGKRPTAVKAALYAVNRAWIATEDGTLQVYSLGNYASNGSAVASDIALQGSVAIGTNPTALAYVKQDPADTGPVGTLNNNLIVVSRGDKKIQWVTFAADNNTGTIRRTLQDANLKDPVWAEEADNHGTSSYVLTVADYGGKQVSNYRFGPTTFNTAGSACQGPSGCAVSGGQAFERGGSFALPGKAFQLTGANVP